MQGFSLDPAQDVLRPFAELQAPDLGKTWDETTGERTAPWQAPASLTRSLGWPVTVRRELLGVGQRHAARLISGCERI